MGSPELPGDSAEDDIGPYTNHAVTLVVSDESDGYDDDENFEIDYEGYQPVPGGDPADDTMDIDNLLQASLAQDDDFPSASCGNSNFPLVESVDAEVERHVWSESRPRELEIELDPTRTQQIMTAMAGFTLPNTAVPDWAVNVSEDRWKQELLERIRQRNSGTSANEKPKQNN